MFLTISMRRTSPVCRRVPPRRGVASLVVVVVLMAVMVVAAVFTNRSLIVEQKTSANQYRYTLALEAAEAGLEWATAMLNKAQKID
ncbi:MAG: hypothetical protein H6R06_4469, partial [Proteobacteria bacterium]|nr:hypothetical protein [Pseudomonadota bacterium]